MPVSSTANIEAPVQSHKDAQPSGILTKTTPEDQGLVKLPVLAPHLKFHDIGDHNVLLVSESFNTLLRGKLYCDLMPLVDGCNSLDSILSSLDSTHEFASLLAAIVSLSTKGYIVSADHSLNSSTAAYWSSLGASPRWVERRLADASVSVNEDQEELVRHLNEAGISIVKENPNLSVTVCDDFLAKDFLEPNKRNCDLKIPWMLVRPRGIEILFGPIFNAEKSGPCWMCLANRLQQHQEVHNFLRHSLGEDRAFKAFASEQIVRQSIISFVASEIVKWLVLHEFAPLHQHAIALNLNTLSLSQHRVLRRPQCSVCGDPDLYKPNRKPAPLALNSSPKNSRNSGGVHFLTPEETLAKYRHLVSPVSGVVSWLRRSTDETDSYLHVYWAGSNFGARGRSLSSLRRSLRSKSAGKGSTREQSKVSALCEAIERFSGSIDGSEISICKQFVELARDDEAIHPNDVQLFSDYQFDNAQELNAQGHPYNVIPRRFDETADVSWTPVWSFTQERHRYLPTTLLYSMPSELRSPNDRIADSNGCAAGNTLEEAILQAFYELVERDAFAIWWYNRIQAPAVELSSFNEEYLVTASDYYSQLERELWMLDVTSDIDVPTFVAVSRRMNSDSEDIIYGAGTHSDPNIAALRAVCELNQCLSWLPDRVKGNNRPKIDDPIAIHWWQTARVEDCRWLAPSDQLRTATDYATLDSEDMRDDIEHCRSLVETKGMEFLVLNQTRPDIGMPVVRVIIPGMRHFWARFAPGRLYDVPVDIGRFKRSLDETELNQKPVIA
ncbi:MAG: TOMM precursor leader peptide-binding protein [Gammaproteobacteria bacterium]|nr:TOMM precursor leader peptide-binding protein [Gammaproteobacteria bacterium]